MNKMSFIIPMYNTEEYIAECLDSFNLFYNDSDYEIIIINDGSTDRSYSICEEYKNKFNNIKIINISNHGVSYARNLGIKEAVGDYIMFVDSDDKLKSNSKKIIDRVKEKSFDLLIFNKNISENEKKESLINYTLGYDKSNSLLCAPFSKIFNNKFMKKIT